MGEQGAGGMEHRAWGFGPQYQLRNQCLTKQSLLVELADDALVAEILGFKKSRLRVRALSKQLRYAGLGYVGDSFDEVQ